MAALASFVHFGFDFSAGSGSLPPAQQSQLLENRTVGSTVPVGYYSQHIFGMKNTASAFTSRERGMFGIHWINLTGGEIDTTWVTADYTSAEGAIESMWSSMASLIGADYRLEEHRWYGYGAGVNPPNPPSRVNTLATPIAGTGTTGGAHQLASTVTLRTSIRTHWGRIYLPIASDKVGVGGQISNANCDFLAGFARTALMITPTTQGVVPIVYDRARKRGFGVTAIEVDSVPDIIRRRRPRDPSYKKIYTS